MVKRFVTALAFVLSTAVAAAGAPKKAEPKECESFDPGRVIEAVKAAPSCDAAINAFQTCASGASSDVAVGGAVEEKCEGFFLRRLSAQQKKIYDREQRRCSRKYQHEQGSMYRSFTAHCGAEVAQKYARRFSPRGKSGSSK